MGQRLTYHSGYRNAQGKAYNTKHNQREEFEKPGKGDTQRRSNVYWDYGKKLGGETFSDNEKLFYKRFLEPHVKAHNETAKKRRQYARCMTLEQYKEKHPPEEVLFYLGTENVDPDTLQAVFRDFTSWLRSDCWDRKKGCGVMPLNAALHLDETTPHIHMRQVYLYTDKDGHIQVSQNKALEGLGIESPTPWEKTSRKNNPKMTFTALCREKLFDLAESYGVELIREPSGEGGLTIEEYKERQQAREKYAEEKRSNQAEIALLRDEIADLEDEKADAAGELERVRKSTAREKDAIEQERAAAREQGYMDGYAAGVKDGAVSPMARINALRRQQREDEEEREREHPS